MRAVVFATAAGLFFAGCGSSAGHGPAGPVHLENLFPTGTTTVSLGKCLGFTVVGDTVAFDDSASVTVGPLGVVPMKRVDATHLQVGAPETGGKCLFTPPFALSPGAWDVTVTSSTGTLATLSGGLTLAPPVVFDLGSVGAGWVYADNRLPGEGVLETPFDVDIYSATFADGTNRTFAEGDFYDHSGQALVPTVELWNPKSDATTPLGRGALTEVFPQPETNYFIVRDRKGQGGAGAAYDLGVIGNQLQYVGEQSGCAAATPMAPGAYWVDDSQLRNAFDPAGACRDQTFGDPIYAPDVDAAFTVTVPAGKELRAFSYSAHYSQAIYLLPQTPESCLPHPTDCVAGAVHFGSGDTNTVVYDNTSGADQSFYLVFDTTALVSPPSDGAFMAGLEIRDPPR